jgi:hypothetical protein
MTRPDLLELLRSKCAELGQAAVARAVGYSDSAVSQALNGKYQGSLDNLLARVEEVWGGVSVDCPGLGYEISLAKCGEWRRKPFAATNPQRVAMFRACQKCDKGGTK